MKKNLLQSDQSELLYANWLKMVIDMIGPKNLYLVGGRGLGKTSEILAERSIEVCYDMPGGSFAFVGDSYVNLQKNVIKTFLEGWERKGWNEHGSKRGHFVTDQRPPSYFLPSYNRIEEYRHTISVFNGCNFTLVSLDRPSTGAGNNYIHLFGDEVKYHKEDKLKKLTPAIRGDYIKFGQSPFYRGRSFTTDQPDPGSVYEDDWILRMEKNMDPKQIGHILDCAFVINDIRMQFAEAKMAGDQDRMKKIMMNLQRWEERLRKVRMNSTLFYVASSFVNADILTEGYFIEQHQDLLPEDYNISILSMKKKLEKGQMFYGNISDRHFYADGYNYDHYDQYSLKDSIQEDCRGVRYLRFHEKLEAGVDFGNMISMVVGQEQWPLYKILKNLFVLSPQWIDDLGKLFLEFFSHHKRKELDLYYDRAANQYHRQKQDFATKLMNAIEKQPGSSGRTVSTGWTVNLMSVGKGNILHADEYDLMNVLLAETNPNLPKLRIDQFQAKEYKSSLELAPLIKTLKGIEKVKTSEKLPLLQLPLKSTNMSDAGKYLLCRRKWMEIVKGYDSQYVSDPIIR